MNNQPFDPHLSAPLQVQAERFWAQLCPSTVAQIQPQARQQLWRLLALSEFIGRVLVRDPQWLHQLFVDEGLQRPIAAHTHRAAVTQCLLECTDEANAAQVLRQYRNRTLCAVGARELLALSALDEALAQLSELAEALVIGARDWLIEQQASAWGWATNAAGERQPLLILGMGKLGGGELNFSSDIDLIFCYPEHGHTVGGRRQWDNQQYFIRIAQKLINLLAKPDIDGFCYRIDMRLRPFGEAGPLVISLAALEDYYQEQGREWERFAMVKARVLGDDPAASQVALLLKPFIYRRYLDYSAIDALRKMKGLIEAQVRRLPQTINIKLGAGGIREVEFVVQSHQLIRGGRELGLQQPALQTTLAELIRVGLIDGVAGQQLLDGYCFLRQVENRLQALDDKQTQQLPSEPSTQLRLALALGMTTVAALFDAVEQAMAAIHQVFLATIGGSAESAPELGALPALWFDEADKLVGEEILQEQGIEPALWPLLQRSRADLKHRRLGPRGRDTLDKLMPFLWHELAGRRDARALWPRLETVLKPILSRTTYLELLLEKPRARSQLATLCAASPWIAEQLARYPILLDELIDPVALYQPLPAQGYAAELREFMMRINDDDLEQQMDGLRQFKQAQQLRIAAADITGALPVMQVSDHLSWLAEAMIEQVVQIAWQQVTARHGVPAGLGAGQRGFGVVAYGKLGGLELGYGSDLDLVFLHQPDVGPTNGDKPLDCSHFYVKLAQRILHLFATRTNSGVLYEVDMRLRPSGQSGLLVSPIERFASYQQQEAWVWEHQALCRARFVGGDEVLAQQFAQLRRQVLMQARDLPALRHEIVAMREKMRAHLNPANAQQFDLKQGLGGITDIEFISQYLVLAFSHQVPSLARYSDNVRILEAALKAELISARQADLLSQAYTQFRDAGHHRVLAGNALLLSMAERPQDCDQVAALWQQLMLS
ncbi:MAG: bifunctional [glutamate--ammonia ligase]-adenylyl-L-tyrosine phosphorylase/[glutamate--ammonia-ligase] adenylyltransferase [Ferrimonas sp.]